MSLPALPRTIQGLAGPIRIDRPLVVNPANPTTVGEWHGDDRRILIRSTIHRDVAWQILLHEIAHAALEEAGVTGLSSRREEQIVEAVASGMIHVVRHLCA